jgi:hypothetical protein
MRRFLFFLILFSGILLLGPWQSAARAAEVVLGTVVAVDRDQGRVTLKVIDSSGNGNSNGQNGAKSVTVMVSADKIPDGLTAGDTVRVWGEYSGNGGGVTFRASAIRKRGSANSGNDPTGVRSRLGQGWQGGQGSGSTGRGSGKK